MFDYDKHESKRDLYVVLGELAKFSGDKETFNFFDKFPDCSSNF